jgi:hypothetical protein
LDKSGRKKFDEMMFDIPRSTFLPAPILFGVQDYPILVSILFHHYKQLTKCIKEVEQIEAKVEGFQQTIEVA